MGDGDVIHYYMKKDDSKPRGYMNLKGATLTEVHYDDSGRDNCFSLTDPKTNVTTLIAVETTSDYHTWITCIRREINGRPPPSTGASSAGAGAAAIDTTSAYDW